MKRLAAVLVPLALVVVTVRAAENWTHGESDRFEVYTTANPTTAGDALATFEGVYAFLASNLRLVPLVMDRTRLIVFSNDKEFAPYRAKPNITAFYQTGADRDYLVLARLDKDSTSVAVHEYAHLFFRDYGGRFPVWLREGMAEAFSTMRIEQGRARYGEPPSTHLTSLRSGVTLLDVNRLFAVEPDSPEYKAQDHTGVLYAQSWALVHMLLMDRRYDAKFWDFVGRVGDGASSSDALTAVYGKTPDAVMSELASYIKQPQSARVAPPGPPRMAPTFRGRKADPFEISLVTATVRADAPGGEAEARATLQRLDKERPRALSVLEARAYLELRRSGRAAALPFFESAVAEGTRNAKLVQDYARLEPAKAASLLPKALELAPDDNDLRLDLATMLLTERKADQVVSTIAIMNGLSREQSFRRLQLMANAQFMVNHFADARESANAALRFADSARRREDATALIARIDESDAKAKAAARDAPAISFSDDVIAAPAAATKPTVPVVQPEQTLTVMGRIRNIVCLPKNGGLVFEVLVDKQTLRLLLAKPESVSVRGVTSGTVDLNCGKQDQPVKVGFLPRNDAAQKTQGDLRVLDYSQ